MMIKKLFWTLLFCCAGVISAQTYRVGDLYTAPDDSRGIVFYVLPDGSGGWVVALNDASASCAWGNYTDILGLDDQLGTYAQVLLADTSGYNNTALIRDQQHNSSYAAGVVDFAHGWYLPSPGQLRMIHAKMPVIDSAIIRAGGSIMAKDWYWCSAEQNSVIAWRVDFGNTNYHGRFNATSKTDRCRVRAVRSFSYAPTYVWSTGDTTVSITVAPEQTTAYTVSVSNPVVVCTGEATQTILVNPLDTIPVVITECESYTWHGITYDTSGIYPEHYLNRNGCDSVEILYLTINNPNHQSITESGIESYEWHDSVYTQSGEYLFSHQDEYGCIQVDTLYLTIYHGTSTQFDTTVCESDLPIEWGGAFFEAAGTHIDTQATSMGADSLIFWNLHVVELPIITHTPDTAVLAGDTLTLWAVGSDILTWTDGNGAPVGSGETVSIRPLTSGYYYVTGYNSGEMVNQNLLENGDFELGNVGFSSQYFYVDSLHSNALGAGNYTISDDAHHVWSSRHQYGFGGSGLFMIVDGANQPDKKVWGQTVEVHPNTDYHLSAQFLSVGDLHLSTADLQFKVNGALLGDNLHLSSDPDLWQEYAAVWKNTTATTAVITLVDTNLIHPGNDFGVDHIRFTPMLSCPVTDSIWVEVLPNPDTIPISDTACAYYVWYGDTLTQSDVYYHRMVNQLGYDSVEVLTLTVFPTTSSRLDTTVVQNRLPVIYNDSVYASEGTYFQHFVNAHGCDSILTITLSVHYNETSEIFDTICENLLPFTWNGVVFDTAGTRDTVLRASTGADSTVVMNLTVRRSTTYTDVQIACDSLRWIDGNLYTVSTNEPTFTLTNAVGCDSVVTLHLTVKYSSAGIDTLDVCDSLRWIDGNLYTENTNTPTFTLTNAVDCDSVVTLHLTVKHSTNTTINAEIIQNDLPYLLNDSTYTATGTYYQHLTNAAGCDSTVTLNLTVYYNTTSQVYDTVCANALPYTWNGHVFEEAGTFTDTLLTTHYADSVVTYTLTVDNISTTIGNVDHIVCYGDSTGFATAMVTGGQPPMTCAWTNTANTTLSTTTTLIDVPAGFYTFTVTDVIGCTAVDTVTIVSLFGEVDPGTISADQVVCVGEQPAPFTGTAATGSDHITYFWEFSSDGEIWSTAQGVYNTQNYTYPYPAPFSFYLHRLSIIQGCGIYYSNVVTVSVWPNTIDTITAAVCQNEPYEGYGFDITADQTAAPGDYTFEQHYTTGHCDSVVVLVLTVNPLFDTEVEDEVCEGEGYNDNGFVISSLETVGAGQLMRTMNLQSAAGCDSVVTLRLRVVDTAVRIVSLTPDFCEEMEAELQVVTDMPNYVWSTGETSPNITVTHSGRYYVTAVSGECSNTAYYTVENCGGNQLLLPNAITPSRGDGLNDYFSIPEHHLQSINLFEIWIYNRWGELVYYTNDKNFRWNGEYRGQTQYQTVYNYVIRYTDAAGKPYFVKGSVTVL